ncbi:MAG: ABC transporter ATP-binding protein [Eubacteriales bacterium]|nr:ABC transporter ATP-binding protein [Eubacteriales bacterium]
MIEVRHLTKRYGGHTAVSDLSFTIDKGRVYGFLGPNGAGKSTTMNIMTGCLGATEGEVLIDGHNIMDEPMKAKKLIGYLPELPPLYMDMTPREYLRFVLQAKGVPHREWQEQLERVMDKTRITDVQNRLIRNLSKGYRQRVGIAQALIGNPEVIILDEPTVGLDPAQIIEIRELIRELGREHTLVLSSHILSEVQAVCDSIMIISKGRLVASDTPENLTALLAGASTLELEIRATEDEARTILGKVENVADVTFSQGEEDAVHAAVTPQGGADIREAVFNAFAAAGRPLLEMRRSKASLEDVFMELTQAEDAPQAEAEPQAGPGEETDEKEGEAE